MNLQELIQTQEGTILDVRTDFEFETAHADHSINISLYELPERMEEIKALQQPIILCCASGGRSAQAHNYLSQQGIACHDAGSWTTVQLLKNN